MLREFFRRSLLINLDFTIILLRKTESRNDGSFIMNSIVNRTKMTSQNIEYYETFRNVSVFTISYFWRLLNFLLGAVQKGSPGAKITKEFHGISPFFLESNSKVWKSFLNDHLKLSYRLLKTVLSCEIMGSIPQVFHLCWLNRQLMKWSCT